MLTGTRHTALLVLGCLLLAVGMAACGSGAPEAIPALTPDIEATVEARIEEKQAEDAALEAKAQAMSKTMLEASVLAVPTATPTPPIPKPSLSKAPATATATTKATEVAATPTEVPPTLTPTPTPTQVPATPTATPTPTPTSTPVVPTPTQVPPTPTPTPTPCASEFEPGLSYVYDDYCFSLVLDEDSSFATSNLNVSGMTSDEPDISQGLLTFEYNGVDLALFWVPKGDSEPTAIVESTYQLIQDSQPSNTFTSISDGDISIDSKPGRFGGFVVTDSDGDSSGGGLIGGWICPRAEISISILATGPDATTLQIRFDRLISGFKCR